MVDTSTKTKAAMLLELESIKGLLLEEDDIPILQEVEDAEPFSAEHFIAESFVEEPFIEKSLVIESATTERLDLRSLDLEPVNSEAFNPAALGGDTKNQQAEKSDLLRQESFLRHNTTQDTVGNEKLFEQSNHHTSVIQTEAPKTAPRVIVEEQQDFFGAPASSSQTQHFETQGSEAQQIDSGKDLLNTIDELEKHTAEVTANKFAQDAHRANARPSLAKATGENPFLPAHIRSRLHGNNPPPLFAQEMARKIASSSVPSRLLGNTYNNAPPVTKTSGLRNALIDSVIEKFMPEIEKELREKLQTLTKEQLENLTDCNP